MKPIIQTMFSGFTAVLITGCSHFTSPMEHPIIEDHSHLKRVTAFATIPSRRVVLISSESQGTGPIFVCAEPAPDVSDNLASSLSVAVSGKGPSSGDKSAAEAATDIAKTLETTAQYLFKRTQGLQLYRDGMYNLCQSRMNKVISNEEFNAKADALLRNAVTLIKAEIPYLGTTQPTNTTTSNTSTNDSLGSGVR